MKPFRIIPLVLAAFVLSNPVPLFAQEPLILGVQGHQEVQIWNGGQLKWKFANNAFTAHNGASIGPVYHTAVRLATTANGTMATAFDNASTVDGVTVATGDRILLKNQTTASENGIYVAVASGAPTRAVDMDRWGEAIGAYVSCTEGTVNAASIFRNTNDPTVAGIIGTTDMTWSQDSGAAALALKAPLASPTFTGTLTAAESSFTGDAAFSGGVTFSGGILNSGSGTIDFSGGTGAFKSSTGANTLGGDTSVTGTIESADATTPIISTATGKTNTGYLSLTGKTSGSFKILPADATAQVVTLGIAAQTTGAATLTIPDMGGVSGSILVTKNEVVAATNVITAAESGSTYFLNHATEFPSTLPAPALGLRYTFIVSGAPSGASYTISANGSGAGNDIIKSTSFAADGDAGDTGTADDLVTFVDGVAVAGDRVEFWCDGTSWFAHAFTKLDTGITFTDAD